jgi:alpha-tubulin suppressor-like RCC1 family protein
MPFLKNIVANVSKSYSVYVPPIILGDISAQCTHTLYVDGIGTAWAWGTNSNGKLGDATLTIRYTPVSVVGTVKTFCKINAGEFHSVAVDKNGQAWAWGNNGNGRLGDNTTTSRLTPVSVAGTVKTFCSIAAGGAHSVAVDKNGQAWAWGSLSNGQLGINVGGFTSRRTPVAVVGVTKTFCSISAGRFFSVAIDKNGQAWGWGQNGAGTLGDNTTTQRNTPVSVAGLSKTFCKISAGVFLHVVAIDKNGQAWGWGSNADGQLGDNSETHRNTPVSVAGLSKTFCEISAGGNHSVAVDKNGQVWSWGSNTNGELGNDTNTSTATPVSIAGATKTFCRIAAGNMYSVAIDKDGNPWAWGRAGLLGDNTTSVSQNTPVRVCNF